MNEKWSENERDNFVVSDYDDYRHEHVSALYSVPGWKYLSESDD
jgi:hypothetical protein